MKQIEIKSLEDNSLVETIKLTNDSERHVERVCGGLDQRIDFERFYYDVIEAPHA